MGAFSATMSQKSLIAVVNARSRQNTWANAVRSTWLNQVPKALADIKFFVGGGTDGLSDDTVGLDCDDSYQGLPSKIQGIVNYAYARDYSYVLKIDDDVVVKPNALLYSGYDKRQYTGRANRRPTPGDPFWVPMGFAYWLNRDCMKVVSEAKLPNNNDDERWVAENLHKNGINLSDDKRYHLYMGGLQDRPQRLNRPLRIGSFAQDWSKFENGFAFCMFHEVGSSPFQIPIEVKLRDFNMVFQRLGEPHRF